MVRARSHHISETKFCMLCIQGGEEDSESELSLDFRAGTVYGFATLCKSIQNEVRRVEEDHGSLLAPAFRTVVLSGHTTR